MWNTSKLAWVCQIALPKRHPNQSSHFALLGHWCIFFLLFSPSSLLLALFCNTSQGLFAVCRAIGEHLVGFFSGHLHQGLEGPVASHLTRFSITSPNNVILQVVWQPKERILTQSASLNLSLTAGRSVRGIVNFSTYFPMRCDESNPNPNLLFSL